MAPESLSESEESRGEVELRPPTNADAAALVSLWRNEKVMRFLGGACDEETAAERCATVCDHWQDHGFGISVVLAPGVSQEPAGLCGLSYYDRDPAGPVELSYMFHPWAWGQGIAYRAAERVLGEQSAVLGLSEVVALTQEANRPSQRLLERLGFVHRDSFVRWEAPQRWYVLALPAGAVGRT